MNRKTHLTTIAGVALFLALSLASALLFLRIFAPEPLPKATVASEDYDLAPMDSAMSPESVGKEANAIIGLGSRFLGQDGFSRTQERIERAFRDAGLEVIKVPMRTAVPHTEQRVIAGSDGQPLNNVEIYPFWPNHMQPMVTPPEGITGRLLLVTESVLSNRADLAGCIAVVETTNAPAACGLNWARYAELKCPALIVAHREGLEAVSWPDVYSALSGNTPVNYVRLAATSNIFEHLDETVTLRVRTSWRNIPNTAVVGIMKGASSNSEAVVVTSSSEACSILPDLAPGVLSATDPAVLLAAMRGLLPYRDRLRRDAVFISCASRVMAGLPEDTLSGIAGPALTRQEGLAAYKERLEANRVKAESVTAVAACFNNPEFLRNADATRRAMDALTEEQRSVLREETRYVLNSMVFNLSEAQLRRLVAFENEGGKSVNSPLFAAYREAKKIYDEALDVSGLPLEKLCRKKTAFLKTNNVRDRCLERFDELKRHHEERDAALAGALDLHNALRRYEQMSLFIPGMIPADTNLQQGEVFTFTGPTDEDKRYRQSVILNQITLSVALQMNMPENVRFQDLRAKDHHGWVSQQIAGTPLDTRPWSIKGFPAFAFVNADRTKSYQDIGSPVELPYMRNMESIRYSLAAYGQTLLSLALGNGRFEQPSRSSLFMEYSGRLFVIGVGKGIVPNYPLKYGLIGHKGSVFKQPGYYNSPFFFSDAYGRYDLPLCGSYISADNSGSYSPEAAGYDANGLISLIKDEGRASQRVYKSTKLGWYMERKNVNIVLFRAAPLTVFDMINPQTMQAFSSANFITRDGLAMPDNNNSFNSSYDGFWTTFLKPEMRYFVTLNAGAANNELVQETRAFMLGIDCDSFVSRAGREIDGNGYLPMTNSSVLGAPAAIARSMLFVNGRRLELQNKYGIADNRTRSFHTNSAMLLAKSGAPDLSARDSTLLARDSAAYAILNHPVIRDSVSEAILSILWYLALLVPFVFFFEKLVFGSTDIRAQLTAQSVIFIVAFALLRLLHPAFRMINSSLMILLGFIIMLIAGGMTILFSLKFQENLEGLRKRRGQVAMAEANTMGMLGTAFALGLNNMRRRYVRTWLTCATLVLITFAMICFTSVQSDIVETERAIGQATYKGMLIKRPKFEPITGDEQSALSYRYGHRFEVAPRTMLLGRQEWDRINYNPVLEVAYRPENGKGVAMPAGSILTFDPKEPLRNRIRLLTSRGWFVKDTNTDPNYKGAIILPDTMARKLGITPDIVDATNVFVTVNGARTRVHGIFDAKAFGELRDLDGKDLLPFDMTAVKNIYGKSIYNPLVDDDSPRIGAESLILANNFQAQAAHGSDRIVSIAVAMPELRYEETREEVTRYLEQNGRPVFYGLGDTAYWGHRVRKRTVAGLVELLVPLLIAALTVLNTMRGSVYERRYEIFVYNAVGIAPKYIFSMFFTEAFVYAVTGSVLGYFLSQGTGRALTALNLTGGLNMTFATSATIHASLAIAAAVFLSTIFPARQALRIAAPAEDSGWTLPEPEGDKLAFYLPFTFGARDRMAVLAFFNRYLLDHGEGGAGRFFASEPKAGVLENPGDPVPELATVIWLKPFDLGVSQNLSITMPTDPETHEYIARIEITRLSGTRDSWMRLNHGFVALLRQRFLHWRAVSVGDRRDLFNEAKQLIVGT